MAPRGFASFKTEEVHDFLIGNERITGKIEDIEFVERDDKIESILVIATPTKRYRVPLSEIRGWSEDLNQAA